MPSPMLMHEQRMHECPAQNVVQCFPVPSMAYAVMYYYNPSWIISEWKSDLHRTVGSFN